MQAGAESMPLPDACADVVWSLASVHHWPDLEGGIAEVARILRRDGRFLAVEKRTEPGASGNASHGWTAQQANDFADMLADRGFTGAAADDHDLGHGPRDDNGRNLGQQALDLKGTQLGVDGRALVTDQSAPDFLPCHADLHLRPPRLYGPVE